MNTDPADDALFDALASLKAVAPRAAHDRRVVNRCHALLARQRARHVPVTPAGGADLAVASAVALYVASVVKEAWQLLSRSG